VDFVLLSGSENAEKQSPDGLSRQFHAKAPGQCGIVSLRAVSCTDSNVQECSLQTARLYTRPDSFYLKPYRLRLRHSVVAAMPNLVAASSNVADARIASSM
jgi:hypothetical protein